jgi:hypothetical protein
MKKLLLGMGLIAIVSMSGCLPVIVAGVGAVGTVAAGRYKYKGDIKKAEAMIEFRDTVVDELDNINKRIDEEGF